MLPFLSLLLRARADGDALRVNEECLYRVRRGRGKERDRNAHFARIRRDGAQAVGTQLASNVISAHPPLAIIVSRGIMAVLSSEERGGKWN